MAISSWVLYAAGLFVAALLPLVVGPDEPHPNAPSLSMTMSFAVTGFGTVFNAVTNRRDPATIDAVWRELGRDGFVSRYSTAGTDDGLPGDEGQFLACSFWLVNALARNGRVDEARTLFERLVGLATDLGVLAEE